MFELFEENPTVFIIVIVIILIIIVVLLWYFIFRKEVNDVIINVNETIDQVGNTISELGINTQQQGGNQQQQQGGNQQQQQGGNQQQQQGGNQQQQQGGNQQQTETEITNTPIPRYFCDNIIQSLNSSERGSKSSICSCSDGIQDTIIYGDADEESDFCLGGTILEQERGLDSNSRKKYVICNNNLSENTVISNVGDTGSWNGRCKCPDGQIYTVNDFKNWNYQIGCYGGLEMEHLNLDKDLNRIAGGSNDDHSVVFCAPQESLSSDFFEIDEENTSTYGFPNLDSTIKLKDMTSGDNNIGYNGICNCNGRDLIVRGEDLNQLNENCVYGDLTEYEENQNRNFNRFKVICESDENYASGLDNDISSTALSNYNNPVNDKYGVCSCPNNLNYIVRQSKGDKISCKGGVPVTFPDGTVAKKEADWDHQVLDFDPDILNDYVVCGNRDPEFESYICKA